MKTKTLIAKGIMSPAIRNKASNGADQAMTARTNMVITIESSEKILAHVHANGVRRINPRMTKNRMFMPTTVAMAHDGRNEPG